MSAKSDYAQANKRRALYLDSGQEYVVTFECNRCEGYRWRAVNPGRNVKRALKALDAGDEKLARDYLASALEDLSDFAKWESHSA